MDCSSWSWQESAIVSPDSHDSLFSPPHPPCSHFRGITLSSRIISINFFSCPTLFSWPKLRTRFVFQSCFLSSPYTPHVSAKNNYSAFLEFSRILPSFCLCSHSLPNDVLECHLSKNVLPSSGLGVTVMHSN